MKTITILFGLFLICGCASIDGELWRSRPNEIVVKEEFKAKGDRLGSRTIYAPKGTYTYFKATELGYLYTCEGTYFRSEESIFGMQKKTEFLGGILLSNRADEVSFVRIDSSTEHLSAAGEIPRYIIAKEIEKNGFAMGVAGPPLSLEQREELGLPGHAK